MTFCPSCFVTSPGEDRRLVMLLHLSSSTMMESLDVVVLMLLMLLLLLLLFVMFDCNNKSWLDRTSYMYPPYKAKVASFLALPRSAHASSTKIVRNSASIQPKALCCTQTLVIRPATKTVSMPSFFNVSNRLVLLVAD